MLTIVPTPIGNLKDITLRALEVLKEADFIICEDTRHSSFLLSHYQIHKPLVILNDFNEAGYVSNLIERIRHTPQVALISDAGTPLISDPGFKLIRECIKEEIEVDSLPGAVSPVVALTLSGLPTDKFTFIGYLPEKPKARVDQLGALQEADKLITSTYILFVAPHKMRRTLEDFITVFGDIEIVLAKELTKKFQKVKKQTVSEWQKSFEKSAPKGEFILLFHL